MRLCGNTLPMAACESVCNLPLPLLSLAAVPWASVHVEGRWGGHLVTPCDQPEPVIENGGDTESATATAAASAAAMQVQAWVQSS